MLEITTRVAVRRPLGRAVKSGSSATTVPRPTMMASTRPRSSWTLARLASLLIHLESPVWVLILPSRVIAHFAITQGLPVRSNFRYGAFIFLASDSQTPTVTSSPASCKIAKPPPATLGNGSGIATTTRRTPDFNTASVQGGVLPKWQHGSRVTYNVPPRACAPARSKA